MPACRLIALHIHLALITPVSQVHCVSLVSELFGSALVPSGYDRSRLKVSNKPKNRLGKFISRKGVDLSIGLCFRMRPSSNAVLLGNLERMLPLRANRKVREGKLNEQKNPYLDL